MQDKFTPFQWLRIDRNLLLCANCGHWRYKHGTGHGEARCHGIADIPCDKLCIMFVYMIQPPTKQELLDYFLERHQLSRQAFDNMPEAWKERHGLANLGLNEMPVVWR